MFRRSPNSASPRSNWSSSTSTRSPRPSTRAPVEDECVEQIDIGGPSMVRAAAKNHPSVAVVVDPLGYDGVLAAARAGGFTLDERKKLASLAFRHTADYDVAVAAWMSSVLASEGDSAPPSLPLWTGSTWRREAVLRYGENPHQQAALYRNDGGMAGPCPGSAVARKRDVLQQLHRCRCRLACGVRPRRDLRGDHQARQSVRNRRSRRCRWPTPTARPTNAIRCRRSAA